MKQNSTVPKIILRIEELDKFAQGTIVKDDVKITPAKVSKEDIIAIYESSY